MVGSGLLCLKRDRQATGRSAATAPAFCNSRCATVTRQRVRVKPGPQSAAARAQARGTALSTRRTERCRPPVQPMAIVTYFFPFLHEPGQEQTGASTSICAEETR